MWNVPYVIAFKNPIKFMTSYLEAVILQLFGLVSESIDVLNSCGPVSLQSSVTRFILFDYIGLILLLTDFLVLKKMQKNADFQLAFFSYCFASYCYSIVIPSGTSGIVSVGTSSVGITSVGITSVGITIVAVGVNVSVGIGVTVGVAVGIGVGAGTSKIT